MPAIHEPLMNNWEMKWINCEWNERSEGWLGPQRANQQIKLMKLIWFLIAACWAKQMSEMKFNESWREAANWIKLKGAKAIAEQLKGALRAMLLFPSINPFFSFIPIAEKKIDEEKKRKDWKSFLYYKSKFGMKFDWTKWKQIERQTNASWLAGSEIWKVLLFNGAAALSWMKWVVLFGLWVGYGRLAANGSAQRSQQQQQLTIPIQ